MINKNSNNPLCIDLDGTIIYSDCFLESILKLIKSQPFTILLIPFWILKGLVHFKNEVFSRIELNTESLPYNFDLIDYIKSERLTGRKTILITASVQSIADSVGNYLGIFDEIYGTKKDLNLKGENKRDFLVKLFGDKQFVYAGDTTPDLKVWQSASAALVVSNNKSFIKQVEAITTIEKLFTKEVKPLKTFIKSIRVYQWIKNILIFLPLVLAHKIGNQDSLIQAILAFIAFSFTASSVYLTNDLLDLESDRLHIRKKLRPLASGDMTLKNGVIFATLLLLLSFTLSIILLNWQFSLILFLYYLVTTAYSFYLKKIPILDILVLASLYTIRIIAGGGATSTPLSHWLLAFTMFLFLSLAVLKRYTELLLMKNENRLKTTGRGYHIDDMALLMGLGPSSGFLAVLVFSLYVNSDQVISLYKHPTFLWGIAPLLLFWISRIWFLATRGQMTDDPIVFAAKDKVSYIVYILVFLLAIGATI